MRSMPLKEAARVHGARRRARARAGLGASHAAREGDRTNLLQQQRVGGEILEP
jgi:hypothetical protein